MKRGLFGLLVFGWLLWRPPAAQAQAISFPDPNLDAAVRQAISQPTGPLTVDDLAPLTMLFASGLGITNLAGLEAATNLTILDLSWNSPADLGPILALPHLQSLYLSSTGLNDLGPLHALTSLNALTIDYNSATNLDALTALENLSELSAVNCGLSNVAALAGLPRLQSLYLGYNSIHDLAALAGLTNLSSLDLSGNPIHCTAPLAGLNNLQALYLTGCSLSDANCLADLAGLQALYLANNALRDLAPLAGLTNLTVLDLTGNPVSCPAPLASLPGLHTLNLSACALSDATCLEGLVAVQNLYLGNNAIHDLAPLAALTNVTYLDLQHLALSSVAPLAALSRLAILNLPGCTLTNLSTLQNLRSVQYLYLADNGAQDLSPLAGLTNLSYLSLTGDPVTNAAPLKGLPRLTTLDLFSCSFSNLSSLAGLTQVRSLSLGYDQITDLSPLTALTNLYALYLTANRLTDIAALTNLPRLYVVDLTRNLLDLSPDASAMLIISNLAGVSVSYLPQNQPPVVTTLPPVWVIRPNAPSQLSFSVSDDVSAPDRVSVSATSSNVSLLPDSGLTLVRTSVQPGVRPQRPPILPPPPIFPPPGLGPTPLDFPRLLPGAAMLGGGGSAAWTLTVTPALNQTGTTTLVLTATDDSGSSTNATILVTVAPPAALDSSLLDDANLTWQTGGNAPWFGQNSVSHDGASAAQSGQLGVEQESWLETTVVGPGILSFWWRISAADYGTFVSFSTSQGGLLWLQGITPWGQVKVSLPAGTNVLRWEYDCMYSSGPTDACWLDQVSFTPSQQLAWLDISVPGNGANLGLHGEPGGLYELEVSTNLTRWDVLGRVVFGTSSGAFAQVFRDPVLRPASFYRLSALSPGTTWLDPVVLTLSGAPQLRLHGQPGKTCELWASTNLVDWARLAVATNFTGSLTITDAPPVLPQRFYRARQLP